MITTDNYEGYLMRYADGELNEKESAMVEAFLETHPEIRDELEAITDPSLKITPPLVTMPGKEALLQPVAAAKEPFAFNKGTKNRKIWSSIAAAIALLLAFGIVLRMSRIENNPVIIAQNGVIQPIIVVDTPLPDSLYIGHGKPAPVLLAKNNTQPQEHGQNSGEETQQNNSNLLREEQSMLAQNNVVEDSEPIRSRGNVIVIETDQLVTLIPKPEERHDLLIGSVIENNNIALAEEKSMIGKAFDAFINFLLRRTDSENDTFLAFSD